jgi:tetratricopeptide (TPR) repeat protein
MIKRRWLVSMLAVVVALITIGTTINRGALAQSAATPTPSRTPFLTDFIVLLAPIPRAGTFDAAAAVRSALNATNFRNYRVTLTTLPRALTTRQEAIDAARANANAARVLAVIWGEAGASATAPMMHIELLRRVELESYLPGARRNLTLNTYYEYPTEMLFTLDPRMDAATVSNFVQTQIYIGAADYNRAFTAIDAARTAYEANTNIASIQANLDELDFSAAWLDSLFGRPQSAVETYEKLATGSPRAIIKALAASNSAAIFFDNNSDPDEIERALEDAFEADAGVAHPFIVRGVLKYLQGEDQEGLADLDDAIKLEENNLFALSNRGWLQYRAGDTEAAVADLTRASSMPMST